ncbi:hypothetical protein BO70DRAFT_28450 [Aspergillus heteromorphus CBS 117.55]|uniref:Nucleoside phosphorylase domain-containing protein n=1 Tax=Aspergillus heteromorphus CBS 117.55 TaxID=1448321 RepID=A0A317WB43_9EURO|nr:uncharacterized protein BO70DRAFT_28450 [Aspergillus heteromorphus CBS 117.55]PWY83563.1 hypothetical protein BO70DRAFT_28450 [Aspergillus heteromorphus CBS 117.55]
MLRRDYTLPKTGFVRDGLAQKHRVFCFETEAAGVLQGLGLGCLIVRGVESYCDSHRNEMWQGLMLLGWRRHRRGMCVCILVREWVVYLSQRDGNGRSRLGPVRVARCIRGQGD